MYQFTLSHFQYSAKLHVLSIRFCAVSVYRQELSLSQGSPACCNRDQWHFFSFSCAASLLSDLKCLQLLSQLSTYLLFQIVFFTLLSFFIHSLCPSYTILHKLPFDYIELCAFTVASWVLCQLPKILSFWGGNGTFSRLNFNWSIILTRALGSLWIVSFRNIFKRD